MLQTQCDSTKDTVDFGPLACLLLQGTATVVITHQQKETCRVIQKSENGLHKLILSVGPLHTPHAASRALSIDDDRT
jgi:hypothetical protein